MTAVFTIDQSGDSALNVALASGLFIISGSVLFSGSYPAGGEPFDLAKGIASGGVLRRVISLGDFRGLTAEYVKSTKKLMLFIPTTVATGAFQEHGAAAYDTDLTASAIDFAFLVKFG